MTCLTDIAGTYEICAKSHPKTKTERELFTIEPNEPKGDRCFSIVSTRKSTHVWKGDFKVHENYVDFGLAEGTYEYPSGDHGIHKYIIDSASSQILIYGKCLSNQSEPPFWYILKKK